MPVTDGGGVEAAGGGNHAFYSFFISCVVALESMMLGYDISIMSTANLFIQETMGLSVDQVELETGIMNLAGLPGALLAGPLADFLGRKNAIMVTAMFLTAGAIGATSAPGFAALCAFRVLLGLGVGLALALVPMYIAEVAPAEARGFMVALSETSISIGIFLGFAVGWVLSSAPPAWSWRAMLGLGATPAVIILFAGPFLPESPRWLAAQGRLDEAKVVLEQTSSSAEAARETFEGIERAIATSDTGADAKWLDVLSPAPRHRRALLIGLSFAVMQQCTGIEAVMYYTPEVLEAAGIRSMQTRLQLTLGIGFGKLAATLVASLFFDAYGRRPIAIGGWLVICAAHGLIAAGLRQAWMTTVVVGQIMFTMAFAASAGPLTWVVMSEVFPTPVRSRAMALGTGLNRLTSSLVAFNFLSLARRLTPQGLFEVLFAVNLVSVCVIVSTLPETKGASLETLQRRLSREQGVPDTPAPDRSAVSYGSC